LPGGYRIEAYLEYQAKGKVNLVKEGGAWKLDEEFWAT
jgi:hypothetical protein